MTPFKSLYKSLPAPSKKTLIKIILFWMIMLLCLLVWMLGKDFNISRPWYYTAAKISFNDFIHSPIALTSFGILILFSTLHYWILRLPWRKIRSKITIWENFVIISLLAIGSFSVNYSIHSYQEKRELIDNLIQKDLNAKFGKMFNQGRYVDIVNEMEKSIQIHRKAVKMLDGDTKRFQWGGGANGLGYLYTSSTLGWEHAKYHFPHGPYKFLGSAKEVAFKSDNFRSPEWQNLAKELVKSKEYFPRAIGFWFLEDKENFMLSAYEGTLAGEKSCFGFALHAASRIDTNPARSWEMITKVYKSISGHHTCWEFSGAIVKIGNRAEENGIDLGVHTELHKKHVLIEHKAILEDIYGYDRTTLPDYHEKALIRHHCSEELKNFYARAEKIQARHAKEKKKNTLN